MESEEVAAKSELKDAELFHQIPARQDSAPQVLEEPAVDTSQLVGQKRTDQVHLP